MFGRRVYLQSPRITLLVGTAGLLAATWPRKLRQADEGGSPAANCASLHSAALPGVRGQIKSPPPYDTLPKGETDTNQTEN